MALVCCPDPTLTDMYLLAEQQFFTFALPNFPGYPGRNIIHSKRTRARCLSVAAPFGGLCVPPSWRDDQAGKGQLC